MNSQEYAAFTRDIQAPRALTGRELANQLPRTLIYGYTVKRGTFHVYLDEAAILNRVIYDFDGFLVEHATEENLTVTDYAPSKRAYPERCDLEFCRLLVRSGLDLPFTAFNEQIATTGSWHGKRKEELIEVLPTDRLPPIGVTAADLGIEDKLLYVGDSAAAHLNTSLTSMIHGQFGRLHLLRKLKGVDDTAKWLDALPRNIEFEVRDWAERWQVEAPGLRGYTMHGEAHEALRKKICGVLAAAAGA